MTEHPEIPGVPADWLEWRLRLRGRSVPVVPGESAQEIYATMIKHVVSPALRAQGLVGSGGRYSIRSDTHWAMLGFQKSSYSDHAEVRFTVNLNVVNRAAWDALVREKPYYGPRMAPTVHYGEPVRSARIGELEDTPQDIWWRVFVGQDMPALQEDLLGDLIDVGIPWLRHQIAETA